MPVTAITDEEILTIRRDLLDTLYPGGSEKERPLEGQRIAGCLHVTKETAVLVETLIAAGAKVAWSGCNPLSTNDEVAAALAANDVPIYAWHGMNTEEFYWAIDQCLEADPTRQ